MQRWLFNTLGVSACWRGHHLRGNERTYVRTYVQYVASMPCTGSSEAGHGITCIAASPLDHHQVCWQVHTLCQCGGCAQYLQRRTNKAPSKCFPAQQLHKTVEEHRDGSICRPFVVGKQTNTHCPAAQQTCCTLVSTEGLSLGTLTQKALHSGQ